MTHALAEAAKNTKTVTEKDFKTTATRTGGYFKINNLYCARVGFMDSP
jgi:hypothetical protein